MSTRGVRKDVNGAVWQAVDGDVYGAVRWAVYDVKHPALQDFLRSARRA